MKKTPRLLRNGSPPFPENEQSNLVGTIATKWADNNWPEASRWIETLSGKVRDYAISNAMNREGATENDSLTLALSIRNDELRHTRIGNVVRQWTWNDAQSAEAWVKSSPLSPEEQEQLLTMISEARNASSEATAERVIIDH